MKSFIEKVKQFGWIIINKINIENYGEYKEVSIVFTKRKLTESIDNESDIVKWENIQSQFDIYELYDLLIFKYGPIFIDTKENIDEYDGDYNPDYIYDVIELELKSKKLWIDFINNYNSYQNDKDESDPFHWKYRKKMQDNFTKNFKSSLESMKYIKRINEHIIDYDSKNISEFYNDLISELKNTQIIPFDKVQEIGNKNDIEVVDYKGFKDEISEEMKKGAPPSTTPLFGLVNPKTKKIRLVITVPSIGRPFIEMAYHMIKHENIHIGQYKRKNISTDSEFLGDIRDLKKYFSNKDEVMAFSQSISDMIMSRGPKNLKDAIQRIKNNELYNDIKKHVDEEILKRYQKYIFLYLEKEFEMRMKHLKTYESYKSLFDRIDYSEIDDILTGCGMFDEFPELSFSIENSKCSYAIERMIEFGEISKEDAEDLTNQSFFIEIFEDIDMLRKEVLYYTEPRIWKIIEEINLRLKSYGLKVCYSEFGANDLSYELIITDINYNFKKLNESSIAALKYKFRKNDLIPQVKDILNDIDDNFLISEVFFEDQIITSSKTLVVNIKKSEWVSNIKISKISDSINHMIDFLKKEGFNLNYLSYQSRESAVESIPIKDDIISDIPDIIFNNLVLKFISQ